MVIEQDIKNKVIWFSYNRFWLNFEEKLNITHKQTRDFLRIMVKKHLKLTGYKIALGV